MSPWLTGALMGGLLVLAGITFVEGMRKVPPRPTKVKLAAADRDGWWDKLPRRTRQIIIIGVVAGVIFALFTGWVIAIVLIPATIIGLPWLLSSGDAEASIDRLEAMEEWTRSLAGVLTVGVGLEQAIVATLRSAPKEIEPEVNLLAARLRARWPTDDALRAFADDLDDSTGDLLAANLLLGAQRRGAGLASVLESVAVAVGEDVRSRRMVEADRAKPRATARWVTIITLAVLVIMFFFTTMFEPYRSGIGQVILTVLLAAYVGALVWMKSMAKGKKLPRFIGNEVAEEARR
ncbi:type II secretion system F family protein [Janibacter sp. YB324]|uniref:type II secretion system F family protein n=1 Tax=Janibacter sp. YB324 TaxID=2761047 RepID=UPI001CB8D57D|nr:type II secretion system F family protein [Janibacter sp. YB324]